MVTDCHEVPDAAAGRRCVPLPPPPPRRSIKPTTPAAAVYVSCARVKDLYQVKETLKKLCEFSDVAQTQPLFGNTENFCNFSKAS